MTSRLFLEARRRLFPNAIFFFVVWPVLSVLFAAIRLRGHPISAGVPFRAILSGTAGGALHMTREFGAAAILGSFLSTLLFAPIAASEGSVPSRAASRGAVGAEPLLLFAAVFLGACLEYPALVYHPALFILRSLPVYLTVFVLAASLVAFAVALGWLQGGPRRAAIFVAAALAVSALTRAVSKNPERAGSAGSRQTVLLGIDSVSQEEDVSALRNATKRLGGIWYEKAVPPGLLTNSVWPSILMNRRPSETGIFFIFQKPNWAQAPFNLVLRARQEGCMTFAFLETGFSAYIGREAGFDKDGSGPRGWLQPATAGVKNASVLLSILLPRLPALPGALTPANQTGTFAYDLRREVRRILKARVGAPCSLIASHLDYLHQTAFPAFSQMTPAERRAVWAGRTRGVRDLDLDWQNPDVPDEPLDVSAWKLAYIQKVIIEELGQTRFLDPARKNRLILFSDHGIRRDISESNFGEARYHRVLFATFGVPPRDAALPISLLDIPEMLGLGDPRRPGPAEPVVEYANATPREWSQMMDSARLESDGSILLNPKIVEQIGQRMTGYRPYSGSTDYCPAPAITPIETSP